MLKIVRPEADDRYAQHAESVPVYGYNLVELEAARRRSVAMVAMQIRRERERRVAMGVVAALAAGVILFALVAWAVR